MAIQNFLNGGYIGKLGQTVGQRWKDKKIIRTYVVPKNPNTPAQKQMREQFATANRLAQQAMTINGHQGIWDTSKVPEYLHETPYISQTFHFSRIFQMYLIVL